MGDPHFGQSWDTLTSDNRGGASLRTIVGDPRISAAYRQGNLSHGQRVISTANQHSSRAPAQPIIRATYRQSSLPPGQPSIQATNQHINISSAQPITGAVDHQSSPSSARPVIRATDHQSRRPSNIIYSTNYYYEFETPIGTMILWKTMWRNTSENKQLCLLYTSPSPRDRG